MSTATAMVKTRRTASRVADAELGERAHMLIWRAGRSQGSVAESVGIEPTAFGKKLKGKNGWALQEVKDLAVELGTTVAFLFGETENPRPVSPDGGDPECPQQDSNLRPADYKSAPCEVIDMRAWKNRNAA